MPYCDRIVSAASHVCVQNGMWFAGLVFRNAVLPAVLPLSQLYQESTQVKGLCETHCMVTIFRV